MSRAFVKDDDGGEGVENLPDRPISPHRNLVTATGLAGIEAALDAAGQAYAEAQVQGDRNALQRVARDLRYWTERRRSAEPMPDPVGSETVRFGSRVTLERPDGARLTYRIVGEDEADPANGTISYVAPLARALMGKAEGDDVTAGAATLTILAIA